MALLLAGLSFLIVLPVLALFLGSFLPTPPRAFNIDWAGLTLANYGEFSQTAASSRFYASRLPPR